MNCKRKIDKGATGLKLYRLIKKSGLTYAQIAEYLELQTPRVINLPLFLVGTVTGAFCKILFVYSSGNHHIAFFG